MSWSIRYCCEGWSMMHPSFIREYYFYFCSLIKGRLIYTYPFRSLQMHYLLKNISVDSTQLLLKKMIIISILLTIFIVHKLYAYHFFDMVDSGNFLNSFTVNSYFMMWKWKEDEWFLAGLFSLCSCHVMVHSTFGYIVMYFLYIGIKWYVRMFIMPQKYLFWNKCVGQQFAFY